MSLNEILREAVQREASDVLLIAGLPVSYKVNGHICREGERLFPEHTRVLVEELYSLAARPIERFLETGDDDFSFALPGLSRFRVNALRQRGSLALVIRVVSFSLPDWRALGIPENVIAFANFPHGLVLFTGPAGSGKSTTLACLVDTINTTREAHVITIEDPLEYLHQHKKSVVTQRELYTDTRSYEAALRAALREAPDVILLGEMRDAETIKAAVTAAETGHLVISTLHTIGAANTGLRPARAQPLPAPGRPGPGLHGSRLAPPPRSGGGGGRVRPEDLYPLLRPRPGRARRGGGPRHQLLQFSPPQRRGHPCRPPAGPPGGIRPPPGPYREVLRPEKRVPPGRRHVKFRLRC